MYDSGTSGLGTGILLRRAQVRQVALGPNFFALSQPGKHGTLCYQAVPV